MLTRLMVWWAEQFNRTVSPISMIWITGDEITTEMVGGVGRSVWCSDSYSCSFEMKKRNYLIYLSFEISAFEQINDKNKFVRHILS